MWDQEWTAGRFWTRPPRRGAEVCEKSFHGFGHASNFFLLSEHFNELAFLFLLGVFCCGPAPVKAIKDRRIDLFFDIPFVYAEVNADVHVFMVSEGRVVSHSKDTERVGSLICTKAVGVHRHQNITGDYKFIKSTSRSSFIHSSSGSKARILLNTYVFFPSSQHRPVFNTLIEKFRNVRGLDVKQR